MKRPFNIYCLGALPWPLQVTYTDIIWWARYFIGTCVSSSSYHFLLTAGMCINPYQWLRMRTRGYYGNLTCILIDMSYRVPDNILFSKSERKITLFKVSCPADINVLGKEQEKVNKYQALIREMSYCYNQLVDIVPVIFGHSG